MNLSRYFAGKKTATVESAADNPFRWAENIGDSSVADAGDSEGNIFDEGEAFEVEITQSEPVELNSVDGLPEIEAVRVPGEGVKALNVPVPSISREIGEIVVKRNDLWESDWEVRVAGSRTAGIELKPAQNKRSSRFSEWVRGLLGLRVGVEDRKAVDL